MFKNKLMNDIEVMTTFNMIPWRDKHRKPDL